MFALCIESSHRKGMGHLYRALNFINFLKDRKEDCVVFLNEDAAAIEILRREAVRHETVLLDDCESNWESRLIKKYGVDIWINDRLDTDYRHSENIKGNNIHLVTFDDNGSGAGLSDINVAALAFHENKHSKAAKTLEGIRYLVLNREILKYRRLRKEVKKAIVTLGGSDTYGVTVKVVSILKEMGKKADIHIGPSFKHEEELNVFIEDGYKIIRGSPSLIKTFYDYDIAFTGGGITPFEANASGLPCVIIANEQFEIANGNFLSDLGSSIFAGFHERIDTDIFNKNLDIERMSSIGIKSIPLNGAENIYIRIKAL